jgi:hypothetical protein
VKKLAFFSKTNVMIQFLHNLALFWAKNAIFSPNFSAKLFKKNHNIGPRVSGKANNHPIGENSPNLITLLRIQHLFYKNVLLSFIFPQTHNNNPQTTALKYLIPKRDSNPRSSIPKAVAMTIGPCRQTWQRGKTYLAKIHRILHFWYVTIFLLRAPPLAHQSFLLLNWKKNN